MTPIIIIIIIIIIRRTDKGGCIKILDTKSYASKMNAILADHTT